MQVEEAALTGESHAAIKRPDPVPETETALGDRSSMAYMGTTVTDGRGRLIVTATGIETELGKIGIMIEEAGSRETPLEQKLDRLGRALVVIVLVLCVVIVLAGRLRGIDLLHMLEVGISLAIAAVPEGLPAVATMTLAVGMQRMARMRALDPPPARGRDARFSHRHLHRQDRDPDQERDDGAGYHPGRTESEGHRQRIFRRGPVPRTRWRGSIRYLTRD